MNREFSPRTAHVAPEIMAAYAGGVVDPAETWSLERHLIGCAHCRAELAGALPPQDVLTLRRVRDDVLSSLPARPPGRGFAVQRLRLLLPPGPFVAVAVALAAAVLLDVLAAGGDPTGGLTWLLVPAIPVAGVALAAVAADDPCREAVVAATADPLRLLLWRTLAVLVSALPLSAVAGLLTAATGAGTGWSAAWLLPSLALTAIALALGAVIGVDRSARLVGALWCLAALGPSLIRARGDVLAGLRAAGGHDPMLLAGLAQPLWALVTLLAAGLLVLARSRFGLIKGNHR